MKYAAWLMLGALCAPASVWADDDIPPVVGGRTYLQHQIEVARAANPQIESILVTGTRDQTTDNVVLGSTRSAAMVFSKTPVAAADGSFLSGDGKHFTIREALLSSSGHRLGTIEIRLIARRGQDTAALVAVARRVQADIARATLSAKNAIDPWPYDGAYGPDTYAQRLTERFTRAHPELLVMMIHATRPGAAKNVVIGSNIGRFGKEADEDDLRVIDKGSTNLEIGGDNDRFETELPLLDVRGNRIGALGLVFSFKDGEDREAIHKRGLAIRDELARLIPNNAALFAKRR